MSVAPARTAPRPAARPSAARTERPRLRVVAAQRGDGARVPYFALLATILLAAMLGALALSTSMAASAYTIRDRSAELTALQQRAEALSTQVEAVSAPAAVMARAEALGMVLNEGVVYLRLEDRTIAGGE